MHGIPQDVSGGDARDRPGPRDAFGLRSFSGSWRTEHEQIQRH
jgi:hypothetical protein